MTPATGRVQAEGVPITSGALARRASRIAAVLFVVATASTMAGQMILDALGPMTDAVQSLVALAVALEIVNGLASAGIALALYAVLRRASDLAATGYLGLRVIEGTLGVTGAAFLLAILVTDGGNLSQAFAYHDASFLVVLIVFGSGTFLFYPLLYRYRLVPRVLSAWGFVGGAMLLASCLLILFGRIEFGSVTDLLLSLPIWINEMALAVWLFVRGLDFGHVEQDSCGA